jgi:S1-C subfamily serine protease
VQTEALLQQARAQARIAADQARVQARLDANQARLEGQVAAQEAATQAGLDTPQGIAAAAPIAEPSLPMTGPASRSAAGTMELITLTPRLGSYFGTDRGVLVARAPAKGMLKLQDGDVILSIGGRIPASGSQAIRILTSYDPGEKISMIILREHHRMKLTTTMPPPPGGP